MHGTPFKNIPGIFYIQFVKNFLVKLSSIGTGPDMKNKINVEIIIVKPLEKLFPFHLLDILATSEIFFFVYFREIIN